MASLIKSIAGGIFEAGVRTRHTLARLGILRKYSVSIPVVSIGGIEIGGSGKTPLTIHIVRELRALGYEPVVLSRGYGRQARERVVIKDGESPDWRKTGDEPLLIHKRTGTPLVVHSDRVGSARLVESWGLERPIAVLDDGFQHIRLRRDVDIVTLSEGLDFSSEHFFPAGRLRDLPTRLIEAEIVCIKHKPSADDKEILCRPFASKSLVFRLEPSALVDIVTHKTMPLSMVSERKVFLLSAIADGSGFVRTVTELGAVVVGEARFHDHYVFTESDIAKVVSDAKGLDASMIITTEKDAVRLGAVEGELPFYALAVDVVFDEPERFTEQLVAAISHFE